MLLEVHINNKGTEAGEIAQRSRALVAIAEDPGSVPSSHMLAQSSVTVVPREPIGTYMCTYMRAGRTFIHIKLNQ